MFLNGSCQLGVDSAVGRYVKHAMKHNDRNGFLPFSPGIELHIKKNTVFGLQNMRLNGREFFFRFSSSCAKSNEFRLQNASSGTQINLVENGEVIRNRERDITYRTPQWSVNNSGLIDNTRER